MQNACMHVCMHEVDERYVHSLQGIVNRLRFLADALAAVCGLVFQRRNACGFALFQALGVDGREG